MRFSQKRTAIKLIITVESDEGGFHAYCSTLKGLHVSGTTQEEAIDNAKEAVIAYLYSMMKHGDPISVEEIECDTLSAFPHEANSLPYLAELAVSPV